MLTLESGSARLVVAPEKGGRIVAFNVDGLELLVTPDVDDHNFGCFPMVPWAGRVRHGSFDFEGQRHQLPLNNPPHAIHGTARDHPWQEDGEGVISASLEPPWPFGGRVVQQANLTTLPNNSPGDGRGHGTFVAGIAAGQASGYAGASPRSNIVSLDVMDDTGTARTSDVIAAAQWILANKDKYNIKVANFSLHASNSSSFTHDPLDKAVEKLWFSGVTVVAAAGNYGLPNGPSGVPYAPGNDPFVITVGAADMDGNPNPKDDTAPFWSAYGYTNDGFRKPEVAADGRYMVGPIPMTSTLASQKASNIVSPGYIQLSGTSFAAPIVAGIAAQIIARNPAWGPDQIKGALMATARPTPSAIPGSLGLGEVNAVRSVTATNAPNPNKALDQFLTADPAGGSVPVFNAVSWSDTAKASVSWDAVSWSDVSWGDSALAAVSWADISWSDVSWADSLSSADVSWADISWSDSSYEDAAEGDGAGNTADSFADPSDLAAAADDPDLQLPAALVSPDSTATTTTSLP